MGLVMGGKECRGKKKLFWVMEGLYLNTEKNPSLWKKKVTDPLDKSICKQKMKKKNPLTLKFENHLK